MYRVALRLGPDDLRAIAAQVYLELLRGGYTQVCEFHYLHRDPAGAAYPEPHRLAFALADAAADAGIGLTLLPALYERAGFTAAQLRPDQRRFASTPAFVQEAARAIAAAQRPHVNVGVAIHSLRAVGPASMAALLAGADEAWPVHVHVAEQMREVEECVAATGARPIEWLCRELGPNEHFHLVHATHASAAEIDAVVAGGAGVVLCPSTEANLGDGLVDLPSWLAAGSAPAIGSDSQVTRAWPFELRLLEYGQRLAHRARNIAASPRAGALAPAATLLSAAVQGGGRAAGQPCWGLRKGARADLVVLDPTTAGLCGVPADRMLDALVFATDEPAICDVFVAGAPVLRDRHHPHEAAITARFAQVMAALWSDAAGLG
jgi:formimidoylglutamate deiminase